MYSRRCSSTASNTRLCWYRSCPRATVRSEWTNRELNEFWKAAEQQGGVQIHNKSRIFKVLKTPVPLDQQSPPLRALLGYEFFRELENGNFREFDEQFGPEYRQKFLMKLDDLAQDLKDLLEFVEGPADAGARAASRCHFLAVTTHDLQDERDAIRRDLQQHGYTVLPGRTLSPIGAEVEAEVREDLERCSMSIHLIGNHYSLTPENAMTSLVEIQNELAIERGERGGFTRLVWIPPGRAGHRPAPAGSHRSTAYGPADGTGGGSAGKAPRRVYAPSSRMRSNASVPRRRRRPRPLLRRLPRLASQAFTSCTTSATRPLSRRGPISCSSKVVDVVHPVFEGDEATVGNATRESLRTSDGVVIFDAAAHPLWLRRKFSELKKIPGYGRTKPAPRRGRVPSAAEDPGKGALPLSRGHVIPQWDGLSPEPWLPIIARLKG